MNKPIVLSWALGEEQTSASIQDCTYIKDPISLKPDTYTRTQKPGLVGLRRMQPETPVSTGSWRVKVPITVSPNGAYYAICSEASR